MKTDYKDFFESRGARSKSSIIMFEKFLVPFIKSLSDIYRANINYHNLIDLFFHADTRKIYYGLATESFEIPGEMVEGNRRLHTKGDRFVEKGNHIIIREDEKLEFIDVQYDSGNKEQMFRLTKGQFAYILTKIRRFYA